MAKKFTKLVEGVPLTRVSNAYGFKYDAGGNSKDYLSYVKDNVLWRNPGFHGWTEDGNVLFSWDGEIMKASFSMYIDYMLEEKPQLDESMFHKHPIYTYKNETGTLNALAAKFKRDPSIIRFNMKNLGLCFEDAFDFINEEIYTWENVTATAVELCKKFHRSVAAVYTNMYNGMDFYEAFSLPYYLSKIEVNGNLVTIRDYCRENDISLSLVNSRIKSGWDVERAVTTPIKKKKEIIYTYNNITGSVLDILRELDMERQYCTVSRKLKEGLPFEEAIKCKTPTNIGFTYKGVTAPTRELVIMFNIWPDRNSSVNGKAESIKMRMRVWKITFEQAVEGEFPEDIEYEYKGNKGTFKELCNLYGVDYTIACAQRQVLRSTLEYVLEPAPNSTKKLVYRGQVGAFEALTKLFNKSPHVIRTLMKRGLSFTDAMDWDEVPFAIDDNVDEWPISTNGIYGGINILCEDGEISTLAKLCVKYDKKIDRLVWLIDNGCTILEALKLKEEIKVFSKTYKLRAVLRNFLPLPDKALVDCMRGIMTGSELFKKYAVVDGFKIIEHNGMIGPKAAVLAELGMTVAHYDKTFRGGLTTTSEIVDYISKIPEAEKFNYNGVTDTLPKLCELFSLNSTRIRLRVWKGFTFEEAVELEKVFLSYGRGEVKRAIRFVQNQKEVTDKDSVTLYQEYLQLCQQTAG